MNEQQRMLQEKFRQMGVPAAGMTGGNSQVMASPQNTNKLHLLNQIKRGGKKGEFNKFIKAKAANDKFEAIPEPKMRKNPNDKVDPKHVVKPQAFAAKTDPQLNAIEAMFDGGGAGYTPSMDYGQMAQRSMTTELSLDNIGMPSMPDPSMYLAQKNSEAYQQQMGQPQNSMPPQGQPQMMGAYPQGQMPIGNPQPQMNQNSPFAKYTLQSHGQAPSMPSMPQEFADDMRAQMQYNQNADMQAMMEQIAQNIAERKIKQVLSEYSGGKNLFEMTKYKTKDGKKVIKTADGKYYSISPVRINTKG
jgi:hypothetical protein